MEVGRLRVDKDRTEGGMFRQICRRPPAPTRVSFETVWLPGRISIGAPLCAAVWPSAAFLLPSKASPADS